ncbi:MAG: hypothetical protein QOD06_692 [Candidatus Binatota bacterium]|jgi:hypothetical protein|nr:hypothetical protein [Candidatus Binatota bacterium]
MNETTPLHTRTLRYDSRPLGGNALGLLAELRDVRHVGFGNRFGREHPAGVVHHMGLETEIGGDGVVRTADAWMQAAPFDASPETRGEGCRDVLGSYRTLIALALDDSYALGVLGCVGGPKGCFHVSSLAQGLPWVVRAARESAGELRRAITVAAHAGTGAGVEFTCSLADRVGAVDTVRAEIVCTLRVPGMEILAAEGRVGLPPGAARVDADRVHRLAGLVVTKEFTTAALEAVGEGAVFPPLVVAFAPVTAQAVGAFAAFRGGDQTPSGRSRRFASQVDSCHMWRSDGPLVALADAAGGTR